MDIARDVRIVRFLPAYFSAISHLLSLLSREEPSIPEIVLAVGADQSLTSRLLNVVNSPVYGSIRQIGSIDDAVVRIGLVALRNMALAVSMSDITGGIKKEEWKHSIMVAHLSDLLSRKIRTEREVQKFAFVTGLMHDIGKLFLSRRYMLEYQSVFNKINKGQTITEAEKSTFGYDHAMVGGMLLCVWNVPSLIVDAIKLHHEPGDNELARVIYFSNQIVEWGRQPADKRPDLEVMGLGQGELDWIYSDAVTKAHDMESKIH
jgi:putative nucleotidyltransferase with HDIG domain